MTRSVPCRWLVAGCLAMAVATATAVVTSARGHDTQSGYVVISEDDSSDSSEGYLGVSVQRLRSRLREALDIPADVSGLMVTNVHDDTPADEAGLHHQDVILSVNGKPVGDEDEFTDLIRSLKPETSVRISIWRDGSSKDLSAVLGKRPRMLVESWGAAPLPPDAPTPPAPPEWHGMNQLHYPGMLDLRQLEQLGQPGSRGRLGIEIQELNKDIAPYFGVKEDDGVLVWRVTNDSPAEKAGLKAGDVIVEIEGESIDSVSDLREELADHDEGDTVALTWLRHGKSQSASVSLEESDTPGVYMFSERHRRGAGHRAPHHGAGPAIERMERQMEELQRRMDDLRRDMDRLKD